MRIQGISLPVRAVLDALTRSDAPFRMPGTAMARAEAAPPQPAHSLQAATSVQVLVAAAALNETPQQRREREAKRMDKGVRLLERLHEETLRGTPPVEVLEELVEWAETFSAPENPQLQTLARDIEVRVKVELARHERLV